MRRPSMMLDFKATPALVAAVLSLSLSGCTSPSTETAYNVVGRGIVGLAEDGYLVGIEKYRLTECAPPSACYGRRFRDADAGHATYERVTGGTKTMVVTHVVEYRRAGGRGAIAGVPYSAYADHEGYPRFDERAGDFFDRGMSALDALETSIGDRLADAAATATPYTHLIVLAMGWNNDQPESLGRYNRILSNLRQTAPAGYRPLVVGLSWPSVWFSNADSFIKRGLGHLLSYPNKTDDADEVGFTLAGWLLHRTLAGAVSRCGACEGTLRTVALGHSLGARMLSRALFSRDHIETPAGAAAPVDAFIGLQGAFSANRFIAGKGKEGSPYSGFARLRSLLVLTSAPADKANPVARFVTGARHVGGEYGLEAAAANNRLFCTLTWQPDAGAGHGNLAPGACGGRLAGARDDKQILMLDVRAILKDGDGCPAGSSLGLGYDEPDREALRDDACVSAHNDILDVEMARVVWAAISLAP